MPDVRQELHRRLRPFNLTASDERAVVEELAQHIEQELDAHAYAGDRDTRAQLLLAQLTDADLEEIARRRQAAPVVDDPAPMRPSSGIGRLIADARADLRHSLRAFRSAPTFAIVASVTLALGIGATTAMYSVVDAVLVRDLPFAHADRLVRILPARADGRQNLSVAEFVALRDDATAFASIATWGTLDNGMTFTGGDQPERVYGAAVSGDFFATLGVAPLLGRTFTREDERPGSPAVVVVSFDFWRTKLSGARDIIGRTIELQGARVPVIGVMPEGFWFPRGDRGEFWTNYRTPTPTCECNYTKHVIARLAPGVTVRQLQPQLDAAAADVRTRFPGGVNGWSFEAVSLHDALVAGIKPVVLMLTAAVGLVLLIACVNVTNLLLARGTSRASELAVRLALGADGGRLARQLIVETAMLSVVGGLVGIVVARWLLIAMTGVVPVSVRYLHDVTIGLNGHALVVAALAVVVCTMLAGALPALLAARADVMTAIKGAAASRSTTWTRLRDALVVAEIAISLMLVVGAGLMLRSLAKLRAIEVGVRADGVLTASISLPNTRYRESRAIADFADRALQEFSQIPGVTHAAVADGVLPDGVTSQEAFSIEGMSTPSTTELTADRVLVSDDYFQTLGVPIVAGRSFDGRDRDQAARPLTSPAIISRALASRYFGVRDPLGLRLQLRDHPVTIIGVAGDVRHHGVAADATPTIYERFAAFPQWSFAIVARTSGEPNALVMPLRRIVASIDAGVAVAQARPLQEQIDRSTGANRFRALLLGVLASVALCLAAVGIYGLMSFVVGARSHELGVRLAVGARGWEIVVLVVRLALARTTIGIAIGAAGAIVTSRLVTSMLFGVTALDATTFIAVPALFLVVGVIAALVPAWRASRTDPIITLRSD